MTAIGRDDWGATTGSRCPRRRVAGGRLAASVLAVALALGGPLTARALAQSAPAWGRVSFFGDSASLSPREGEPQSLTTFTGTATYRSAELQGDGVEFAFDTRGTGYSQEGRETRVSIYEAWGGVRLNDGALAVRGGHLWLNDLGALGSVAGMQVEWRRPTPNGRLRVGGFGGLEPTMFEAGYAKDVRRYGGYVTFESRGLRRHTAGYVTIRDAGLTERSVLTTTNYVPTGTRVFVYQAAEFDLQGPGGQGKGGLTYFFVNARAGATSRVELQGTYHRGRSIDTRTITQDVIEGRPVPDKALEGLLFESLASRVTVEVVRGVRLHATAGSDRNNRDSEATLRLGGGFHASNLAGSGVDASGTWSRMDRGMPGTYDAYYVSLGRSVGPRAYLSADYSTSLSVVRFTQQSGVVIETRPQTRRLSASAVINATAHVSVLVTVDRTDEGDLVEHRVLAGLSCRLP